MWWQEKKRRRSDWKLELKACWFCLVECQRRRRRGDKQAVNATRLDQTRPDMELELRLVGADGGRYLSRYSLLGRWAGGSGFKAQLAPTCNVQTPKTGGWKFNVKAQPCAARGEQMRATQLGPPKASQDGRNPRHSFNAAVQCWDLGVCLAARISVQCAAVRCAPKSGTCLGPGGTSVRRTSSTSRRPTGTSWQGPGPFHSSCWPRLDAPRQRL